jgi:hypothetical protein
METGIDVRKRHWKTARLLWHRRRKTIPRTRRPLRARKLLGSKRRRSWKIAKLP